ncbi:MAG: toxin-antitoxin system HicB family antitoxin [Ruminiclostridium sp.]|nr:toxin-antitoxin system HicB family antitoxin [Ruminiclostridium sp.]
MLAEAQEINDGSTITLEEFQKNVGDYSGKLNIRIPRSLHRRLSQEAKDDGVSLNQYILYKLAQ